MRRTNLAVFLCLLCPVLAGATTPEWVKSAARQPVKKYADDVNVVTLFDEQDYSVKESGEIVRHVRTVLRILRPEGKDAAHFGVPFSNDSRVNYLKAWTIMPGGQEFESRDKDVLESSASMGFEVYSDVKVKYLKASGADVGSVLAFEYESKERPYTFQLMWRLQGQHPVEHARFLLHLPPHWEYRSSWINHPEGPVANEGGAYVVERIQALSRFAQKEIRYAAIEIGIGGYRPHAAGDIFANRYGDCKDKATLLSSMLNEIGIHSYYVLVHTNRGIFTEKSPPNIGFNHAILAIQLPESSQAKPMPAILRHPRLGQLLIFDPTNDLVPFGEIPYYEQDNYGLLVNGEGGELIHLPLSSPELNRITRTAKLTLLPGGGVKADVEEVRTGTEAYLGRRLYRDRTENERKKIMERQLGRAMGAFELETVETTNLDTIDRELIIHYKFSADHYAKDAGPLLLVRLRLLGEKAFDINTKKARLYDFEFPGPTLQTDAFEFNLPEGYKVDELPEAGKASFPSGMYSSKSENSGNTLRYTREYKIEGTSVPAGQVADLKKFFEQITADERRMAVLKKSN